jgi:integrase
VKTIRICDAVRPFLSREELRKLLDYTAGTQLHDIILLAAMTGLRKGEVLNLTWDDVDLQRGVLLIRSSISYRTKGGKMRVVPLNRTVSDLLKNLPKSSGPIFSGDRGGAYNHDFLSKRFKRAVLGAGLDSRLHFHSLRHTFASLLVRDGVPLYHVQKLLGHSSARVTEIYAHLGQAELGSSVEKLSLSI